jgi:Right handed beta helix region
VSGVLLENSEFAQNFAGITTDSENNDDAPSPQLGSTFKNNFVHDNNNPNATADLGGLRAIGVGLVVAGGRHNVITGNRIERNGAWGILLVPLIDIRKPPKVAHCTGGTATKNSDGTTTCFFDDFANQVYGNKLKGNGFFGNPTNGDLADISGQNTPGNCWHDNALIGGGTPTAEPGDLQTAHTDCSAAGHGDDISSTLADQVLCNTEVLSKCAEDATHRYPRTTKVKVHRLPKLRGMKDPCKGVPANPWCPRKVARSAGRATRRH